MQLPCRRLRRPRRVGLDRGRRPLVRRRWRRGYGVSRPCTARDASQATATTSHATTVPASMQDAFCVPSCPANVPEVSRGAVCRMRCPPRPRAGAWRIRSIRPRRSSVERHGASVPTRVHLPLQLRNTRVSRKLRFGTWASPSTSYGGAPAPDFHRLSGLTSLSGWLPTTLPQGSSHMAATIAPAPRWHQRNLVITLAAAARKADLAPRHYRFPARPLLRAAG